MVKAHVRLATANKKEGMYLIKQDYLYYTKKEQFEATTNSNRIRYFVSRKDADDLADKLNWVDEPKVKVEEPVTIAPTIPTFDSTAAFNVQNKYGV